MAIKLNVKFVWIKGHDGHVFNELADKIASDATFYQGVPIDYKLIKKQNNG